MGIRDSSANFYQYYVKNNYFINVANNYTYVYDATNCTSANIDNASCLDFNGRWENNVDLAINPQWVEPDVSVCGDAKDMFDCNFKLKPSGSGSSFENAAYNARNEPFYNIYEDVIKRFTEIYAIDLEGCARLDTEVFTVGPYEIDVNKSCN